MTNIQEKNENCRPKTVHTARYKLYAYTFFAHFSKCAGATTISAAVAAAAITSERKSDSFIYLFWLKMLSSAIFHGDSGVITFSPLRIPSNQTLLLLLYLLGILESLLLFFIILLSLKKNKWILGINVFGSRRKNGSNICTAAKSTVDYRTNDKVIALRWYAKW